MAALKTSAVVAYFLALVALAKGAPQENQQQPSTEKSVAADAASLEQDAPSVVCFSAFLKELYKDTMPKEMRRLVAGRAIKAAKDSSSYFQNVRNLIDSSLGPENEPVYGFSGARGTAKFNRALRRYPDALQQIQKIISMTEAETAQAKGTAVSTAGQQDATPCQD